MDGLSSEPHLPQEVSSGDLSDDVNGFDETRPASGELADGWSGEDIEQAYQKALAALGDIPWEAGPEDGESPENQNAELTDGNALGITALSAAAVGAFGDGSNETSAIQQTVPHLAVGTQRHPRVDGSEDCQVTPMQVIEAALFVGAGALTAKKICHLLRGSIDAHFVEQAIDEFNDRYFAECRPYEIRLGEGGYRLELRPEYEKLRQRVYGAGPREVKLSQDVLEVLALVAYQQPITQAEIESHGKQTAGSLLRQLIRRDLVAIQRGEGGRKDVRYHTTPRFLTVFGIGSLAELPQPEDLARK